MGQGFKSSADLGEVAYTKQTEEARLRETSGASIYGSELGVNTHTISTVFKFQCSNSLLRN